MIQQGQLHKRYDSKNASRFIFALLLFLAGTLFGQQLFAQPYPLNISIVGTGTVDREPSLGNYAAGMSVLLDALPGTGWSFGGWSGDTVTTNDPITIVMDSAIGITVTFIQDSYTLTLSESGNGTTSKTPDLPSYLSFSNVSIQAFPDPGWTFTGWTGHLPAVANPATVNMDANKIITANFSQNSYELTVETDGTPGASVTPAAPVMVNHGIARIITANVPVGYDFEQWAVTSGTGATIANSSLATTSITLTSGAVTVEASFVPKQYQLTLITDGTPGASVTPAAPVMVNHGVAQVISATVPVGYKFNNWTNSIGVAVFGNDTLATTTATLTLGNATIRANFQKVLQVLNVTIPNETMKIGDLVRATITVSNDAGSTYNLEEGSIGGYTLVNLQRINSTTYRASFTITEGGNSYPALGNIPVTNLVLATGSIRNIPYNTPIVQNNDAIDAKLPVVNTMTVTSNFYKVGDIVTLNINADSTHYTAHPLTTINGIAVTAPNVTFVEVGNGNYRLIYTVLEGNNDVLPGQLAVSLVLVKPSENFNLIPFSIIQPNTLRIDANSPVTTRMEVSQTEVGLGQTVQLVITADGLGYTGGPGTVINGVPITSDRVSMAQEAGGLYSLNYIVGEGDNNVLPGTLTASVVMTDLAGNNSTPYSVIVANALEIYTDPPVAALAAPPQICQGEDAELTVFLSERAPWRFDLSDGTTVTSYTLINDATYKIPITPEKTTSYQIVSVWDRNGTVNAGAGSVQVIVNPTTNLQITNLAPGYSLEDEPFKLTAVPTGGRFSGPGVVPATGYFYPTVAGTVNSPHTLYYTLVNQYNCTSVDSALVFVLSAEGDIFIPDKNLCSNSDPVTVTASNLVGATGSFTLTDLNNKTVSGLTDNGDNTALIQPDLLLEGEYVIIYEYFNGVPLFLRDTFSIKTVEVPTILNLASVFCQSDDTITLESDVAGALFSGPGVFGNPTDGFRFYPGSVVAGTITIECTYISTNGCTATSQQEVTVRFTPVAGFELSKTCIADLGGVLSFENTTDNKLSVEKWEWDFGDPGSGEDNKSTLINPTHVYPGPGRRIISLTATTYEGCVVTHMMDTVLGNRPVADFTLETDCFLGESGTQFFNRSTSQFSPLIGTKWSFFSQSGSLLKVIGADIHLDSANYVFEETGDYYVELLIENSFGCTDTITKKVTLKPTATLVDGRYNEDFNGTPGQWTVQSEDQVDSWIWEVPDFDGFVPSQADKSWYTNLPDEVVGYVENSWVQSPCFDLSGMKHPLIQLDLMKSFASGNGVVLQYMDVFEEGWKTVGSDSPGIEWYNDDDIQNKPGGSSAGWGWDIFNPDNDWVTAVHDMDELARSPYASLRIAYATDESNGTGNQGFAFDNVVICERSKRAVLEHFTNSADAASAAADAVVDAFGTEYLSEMIDIQYHMDYPGVDPMNANNPDPSSTRSFNYGIPKVPYAVLDGGISEDFRFDFSDLKSTPNVDVIKQLTLQVPAFEVELEVSWSNESLEATTSVTCNVDRYADFIQLYVVVFETSVNAYTGINGDTAFRNVVLDMLPTPAGKLLGDNWFKGNNDTRVNTWIYQPYVENVEDLAVVAFVQDRTTKQILQAAVDFKTPQVGIGRIPVGMKSLHIYPNPARTVVNVNLGSSSERDGRFEVIDMNGRIVHSEHVPSGYQIYQMDVQMLNRGFYVIQWYEAGVLQGRNKLVKVD